MSANSPAQRRIGWAAVGSVAVAALAGMGVPGASAMVKSPDGMLMLDDPAAPGSYVVGVKSGFWASIVGSVIPTQQAKAVFADNGSCFFATYGGLDGGGIGVEWTPTTAGVHTISLTQNKQTISLTVTVAPAPAGTPVPTPDTPGCKGGGSIGAGSLGL